jgi:hypothetical protein
MEIIIIKVSQKIIIIINILLPLVLDIKNSLFSKNCLLHIANQVQMVANCIIKPATYMEVYEFIVLGAPYHRYSNI